MKRLSIIFIIFNVVLIPTIEAQENTLFLFEEFQDAFVYFKGGVRSKDRINYDLVNGKIYFIDREDGSIKIASGTNDIIVLKVGERNFIPTKDGVQELMPTTPPIYVQYKVKMKMKAQKGAFGIESETSAITSYSEVSNSGTSFKLKGHEWEILNRYNSYWIEKSGKKRKFIDFKQFLKIYPKHKDKINEYIKVNSIDFNNAKEIVDLCLFAESLDSVGV